MEANAASTLAGISGAAAEGATGTTDKEKEIPKAATVEGAEGQEEEEGLSEEMKEKVEAAKQRTLNALNLVRGTLDGLGDYQMQLRQMMNEQLMLENQMMEAIENTRRMRARIREEQERVDALKQVADLMEPEDDGDGRRV